MVIERRNKLRMFSIFMILLVPFGLYLVGFGIGINNTNKIEFKRYSSNVIQANDIKNWIVKPIYLDDTIEVSE